MTSRIHAAWQLLSNGFVNLFSLTPHHEENLCWSAVVTWLTSKLFDRIHTVGGRVGSSDTRHRCPTSNLIIPDNSPSRQQLTRYGLRVVTRVQRLQPMYPPCEDLAACSPQLLSRENSIWVSYYCWVNFRVSGPIVKRRPVLHPANNWLAQSVHKTLRIIVS